MSWPCWPGCQARCSTPSAAASSACPGPARPLRGTVRLLDGLRTKRAATGRLGQPAVRYALPGPPRDPASDAENHHLTLTAVFFLPDRARNSGGGLVHMKEPSPLLAAEYPMRGSHGSVMLKMLLRTQARRQFLAVQHGPGNFFLPFAHE